MEELPQRVQAQEPPHNFFQNARLLTASATTGWGDWIHGELWVLPDGLLRIPLGEAISISHGLRRTVDVQNPVIRTMSQQELHQLITARANLWIPREHIAKAYLHHGFITDRLLLKLNDGRKIKLLWFPWDGALPQLQNILQQWIGNNLVMD